MKLKRYAFGECNNLVSVNIPAELVKFHMHLFTAAIYWNLLILRDTIISIESLAFYNCTNF